MRGSDAVIGRGAWFAAALVALGVCFPVAARAQDEGAADTGTPPSAEASTVAEARAAFERGVDAMGKREWRDAVLHFRRSYALHAHPSTLLNLATSLAEGGALKEAIVFYKRYLHDTRGTDTDPAHRSAARSAMHMLEERLASIRIEFVGTADNDFTLYLDEAVLDDPPNEPIAVDPGEHTLEARRGDVTAAKTTFRVESAETKTVLLAFEHAPAVHAGAVPVRTTAEANTPPTTVPAAEDDSIFESWWFWGAVGVTVAAVATVLIVSAASGDSPRAMGNVSPPARLP